MQRISVDFWVTDETMHEFLHRLESVRQMCPDTQHHDLLKAIVAQSFEEAMRKARLRRHRLEELIELREIIESAEANLEDLREKRRGE